MAEELPFTSEYAKSGRSSCKGCKKPIAKETLRIAIMVQSQHFDGKAPNWHHFDCFFQNARLKTTEDLEGFLKLRAEDQEKIKKKIANTSASQFLKDYTVEYAKSSRSACRACNEKIAKDDVRVAKKEYGGQYGPKDLWHHLECFVKSRDSLDFDECGSKLPGFKNLKPEDQTLVKSKLPNITAAPLKRKGDAEEVLEKKKLKLGEDKQLQEQSKILFSFRDPLQQFLERKQLKFLLEYNNQQVPVGESAILDALADCMAFGALQPCEECKEGQLVHRSEGYKCRGNLTEWTKCVAITKTPGRKEFQIPEELLDYDFLKNYKYVERERIFPVRAEKPKTETASSDGASTSTLLLSKCIFVLLGKFGMSQADAAKEIETYGGKVVSTISSAVLAVISTKEEVTKMSKKMVQVKGADVHVVSVDFVKKLKDATDVEALILETKLSSWGGSLKEKLGTIRASLSLKSGGAPKDETKFARSGPSTMKFTVKGRSAVEPESGLEDRAHVLEEKNTIYNAILGLVNIARGSNSYYKLQLLESDKKNCYWLFRAWGRVGTTIGGHKVEKFEAKEDAKVLFESLYQEKTGNSWKNKDKFEKQPGRMYPMDIDYGQDDVDLKSKLEDENNKVKSKLHKSVQELIRMIFDVESMKAAMVEFEIDLTKMPLGKLSRSQIEKAYSILSEVQDLMKAGGSNTKFLDASNRFFTLIPHDFGMKTPPILNNEEILKVKMEMLESLLDIEVAYNLLKNADKSKNTNPLDNHYKSLNTTIEVMDKEAEEFKIISKYVKNTHAATHSQYKLKIEEVYEIDRKGERARYKPFKKLPNRQLLWHGSRTTNYAGILSQGLRIAPPEAPVTGYMFGKGLYFADMVSKSANYCFTSKKNPTGLLMLCEVALGNMQEFKNAEFVEKLPPGKHSVKGIGKTQPDVSQKITMEDGIEVPLGKPALVDVAGTSLLYNEYIVYDVSQVNIKYLIKVNFDYKL